MASRNFLRLATNMAGASIDFVGDSFKAILIDNSDVLTDTELDTWNDLSDVDCEHAVEGNYVAGGFDCTVIINEDAANNKTELQIQPTNVNPQYTNATINSLGSIVYKYDADPAKALLVAWIDFEGAVMSLNGDYNVFFDTPLDLQV